MSAYCEMLLAPHRKKGRNHRGRATRGKRYASHDVYMAKPSRGRFAIQRTSCWLAHRAKLTWTS